ncbi:MAG: SEC-C domain-containing protein, partial [Clostridia bacterium]|nr:SEC-C domain-containing protein [Clostridia bacterium]
TLATITFQNYFRIYKKLSGMTGTAKTEEQEFNSIYNLDVVVIETNLPMIRKDHNDIIYKTLNGKYRAVIADIEDCYKRNQPVLVGTISVEKSEELSRLLRAAKIPHNVLNAKNHKLEAEIVAQAGKLGAVTIATNMAGRGTDILLGGNPEFLAKQRLRQKGVDEEVLKRITGYKPSLTPEELAIKEQYDALYAEFKVKTDAEKKEVIAAGGLKIIGTERHDSRRIDNQLRGRAGRQGDPGASVFYISLEDDLARIFGGDSLTRAFEMLKVDEDQDISSGMISKAIENAQRKVESRNFAARKHVLEYDDVMNNQRKIMYAERNKVLYEESVHEDIITKMIPVVVDEIIDETVDRDISVDKWDLDALNALLEERALRPGSSFVTPTMAERMTSAQVVAAIHEEVLRQYEQKIVRIAEENGIDYYGVERVFLLKIVDKQWIDHIDAMDKLRRGISLRAYGGQDPIIAYKKEGFDMFDDMIYRIQTETARILLKIEPQRAPEAKSVMPDKMQTNEDGKQVPVRSTKKPGGNDPCPCGSGLKYKKCCGKN